MSAMDERMIIVIDIEKLMTCPEPKLSAKHEPIIVKHEAAARAEQAAPAKKMAAKQKALPKHKGNGEAEWAEF